MPTICPKCQHVRPAETSVPDWQCPACGVAYAKAHTASAPVAPAANARNFSLAMEPQRGLRWRALVTVAAVLMVLWWGYQAQQGKRGIFELGSPTADLDTGAIQRLAGTVRAEQVVMYSTTECGHCVQAKSWLSSHGFAFTECNMSVDSRCVSEFQALRGNGTPYLVVRGPRGEHHMKNGFDSDEFLAALQG